MRSLWFAALALTLGACHNEKPATDGGGDDDDTTDTTDTDTDTVTDTGVDTGLGADNDTIENASPIEAPPDTVVYFPGEIESPGDRDFYVFDGVANHVYQIYAAGGGEYGDPDTVLRVYGADQAFVVEDDDLPYRMVGTDAGLYYQATVDGPVYVEVLEYSDWAGDPPLGDPTFDYNLVLIHFSTWDSSNEDVNGDDDSAANAFANISDIDGDGNPEYSWYAAGWAPDLFQAEAPGTLDPAGDEDWLWFTVDAADMTYCQFSEFTNTVTAADLQFELWREDCTAGCDGVGAVRVASTDSPEVTPAFGFLYDAGITYPMAGPANYYLRVLDADGSGGLDHWYSAMYSCYLPELAILDVEDGEVDPARAQPLAETVSTTTATTSYARFVGWIDGTPIGGPDQADTFVIDWANAGDALDVVVETTLQGSLLDDAVVTVLHEDSPGNWTEMDSVSGAAPSIIGLSVTDSNRIAVQVRSTSGTSGLDRYYLGLIITYAP